MNREDDTELTSLERRRPQMNAANRHHDITELYDVFKHSGPKAFRWLLEEFGFTLVELTPLSSYGTKIIYKNPTTAVEIRLEPREGGVFVYVISLIDGAVPHYLRAPDHWLLLDCLVLVKSPDSKRPTKVCGQLPSSAELTFQLTWYADVLKSYGGDILRGDHSELPAINKRCRSAKPTTYKSRRSGQAEHAKRVE
jgi:hypothetical protein